MDLNYVEFSWYDPTKSTDDSIWYELQEPQPPIDPTLKEPSNPSIVLVDQNICAVVQEQEMHNLKVKIKNKPTDLGNSTLEFLLACLDLGNLGEEKGICDDDAQVQRQFKKFSKQIENAKEDDKI